MKTLFLLLLLSILAEPLSSFAQDADTSRGRYLSIGSHTTGICFGNSPTYTGLRFNLIDKNVNRVNILNFSLVKAEAKKSNGISAGLLVNMDEVNNGLSMASLYNGGAIRNGIAVGGLFTSFNKINGIGIAGLSVMGDTLNGVYIGIYSVAKWYSKTEVKRINGAAIAVVGTSAEKVSGLTIAAMNFSERLNGLSIGIFNKSKNLHGVQLGLINFAGNNPRGLRWLPFMNFHLGKDKS